MKKNNLFQHVSAEEQVFLEKIMDLIDRLETYYSPQLTDFLDPRQQELAKNLLASSGVAYYATDAFYPLEVNRLLLVPDYYNLEWEDFEMALLEITYQGKFAQLSHSQILGTLLKGLGLKRQVLGDILVQEGYAQVVVDQKMASYLMQETAKIAKIGVALKPIAFEHLIRPQVSRERRQIIATSNRLDQLVAALTKQSRQSSQDLIRAGKVKVNHREIDKTSWSLAPGDLVSIRGFGRFCLMEDLGFTKSGRKKFLIEDIVQH